ncbi:MAG TPA: hypothetical protein VMS78_08975 [Rhizomicrobium sp.]|nr:hypothetical protein [Rhizomicrobium sp.]
MIAAHAISALPFAGIFSGYLYCFYHGCIRLDRLRSKYGSLDLIFWVGYVTSLFSIVSWLAAWAIWLAVVSIGSN